MIAKIDINSIEFKNELENTKKFTKDVLEKHNLVFNPDFEVVESIEMGLTRNQLIYGKKYCPCFMVIKESETEKNRVCPCVPALTKEIPTKGNCHCGIFYTKDKADELLIGIDTKEAIVTHSRGLTKNECEDLLNKEDISSIELEALLEARELGMVDFLLVDTREWMEWVNARIEGTDYLVPTTSFYNSLEPLNDKKDRTIILYCHSGSRSAYCQRVMLNMGFKKVINLDYGIMTWQGEVLRGE
ncbi:ferredoxin-thioredoxin reductase catalytic domain-containing protein [Aliarcobacter skirrowii]|uniref:ferredoxin:thioredoxin reductase n=1 Tax=Aliarcobacter skirrowii TaxID=28200 RepID=A0AAW9DC62_9BACT|nr:ferredoxin-thioredoxin reductase catalytic domain-containing protein [Aliarcobacter skirrowii]MDX4069731.1 ferredoxin-thioredoxin reductase catalytic domain-containing protein [Aliarcobacter skirrowii]